MSTSSFSVVAIDSNILVALLNPFDHRRKQAEALYIALQAVDAQIVYFDCVIAEEISTSLRRLEEKGDAQGVNAIFTKLAELAPPDEITWILPDVPDLYASILELMQASAGMLNFHDALIALACRDRDIETIASLDADFDQVAWLQRLAESSQILPKS